MEHVVIQHCHSGEMDSIRRDTHLLNQKLFYLLHKLAPVEAGIGFFNAQGHANLIGILGQIRIEEGLFRIFREKFSV